MVLTFLINSLLIFGIYASTGHGMICEFMQRLKVFREKEPNEPFDFVHSNGDVSPIKEYDKGKHRNDMLKKPLFNCPPCMASIWGTAGFIYIGIGWEYWIVWVLSLAGFNYIVNKIIDK